MRITTDHVRVKVPATAGNLGPGFDALGMALGVWDEVEVRAVASSGVTIDIEGERTLRTLAGLSGLVGLFVSYWCLRSWRLTGLVLMVAVLSAGGSLAIVHYFGIFEVLALDKLPRLGRMDSVLMSMPALIYVLALSGAIHLVT